MANECKVEMQCVEGEIGTNVKMRNMRAGCRN